ncbi:HD domain-containing protein [Patescibacteria group bacterium]|nr:HD domain-containing protein [Patescibacteria group bacterium]
MKNKIIKLASLILDFGKIERQTFHQDGLTSESDTDHTVMLGVISCSLASKLYLDLDVGLVAQFAFVHDLVEVHAGDTPTLKGITDEFLESKEKRELRALEKIKYEFSEDFFWIHKTIEKYEKLDTKEARFIKTLDKILPKITVILNNAKGLNDNKLATRTEAKETFDKQRIKLSKLANDMPEVMDLWEYFVEEELKLIKD